VVLLGKRRPDLLDAGFVTLDVQSEKLTEEEMRNAGLKANRLSHEDQNRFFSFDTICFFHLM
jgi:hypothetical protein